MDRRNGKTEATAVLDFGRAVKKVRVVTSLMEKEAGAKAARREKDRLGLPCEAKLAAPFKVVLFEKILSKKKTCVFCDFSSYEEARKGERLENFLHPKSVTDFGVQCISCSAFQCRTGAIWKNNMLLIK
jgi:hypothetical protein